MPRPKATREERNHKAVVNEVWSMFSCALIPAYLFIQQVFGEFLLYARHCGSEPRDCDASQIWVPRLCGPQGLREETDVC